MIQPVRRVHRYLFAALALVLPVLLAAAFLLREDAPVQPNWPFESAVEGRP